MYIFQIAIITKQIIAPIRQAKNYLIETYPTWINCLLFLSQLVHSSFLTQNCLEPIIVIHIMSELLQTDIVDNLNFLVLEPCRMMIYPVWWKDFYLLMKVAKLGVRRFIIDWDQKMAYRGTPIEIKRQSTSEYLQESQSQTLKWVSPWVHSASTWWNSARNLINSPRISGQTSPWKSNWQPILTGHLNSK